MLQRGIYIFLTVFWLGVALFLTFRGYLMPDWNPAEEQARKLQWLQVASFIFVGWNLVRLALNRSQRRQQSQIAEDYARRIQDRPDPANKANRETSP
ncbi:hypothetical protein KIH39_10570 [Telmatocola sphagniphila]|uniref:Uncharacterized protein n=1 Tax=Telmatocola sphagniphila TaxID=1123043 RepID=A0A8E6BBW6_9BACT|nr:hypothetical protein [Telmatocola sphagniphila]QVL34323.1 hypothetical protein KIH39_10570 [Telmatocola sphagniphila]